jgi:hypothetical protein
VAVKRFPESFAATDFTRAPNSRATWTVGNIVPGRYGWRRRSERVLPDVPYVA